MNKDVVNINRINNNLFEFLCKEGNIDAVRLAMEISDQCIINWNYGLEGACCGGHMGIIELMISKGANNWDMGLRGACMGGNTDVINLMMGKMRSGDWGWDWGFYGACLGGHMDIVQLMISKGVDDWNYGLYGACYEGHINIVQLMISKGASDWGRGFEYACAGGCVKVIDLLIKKGANDWDLGFRRACEEGHLDIAKLMFSKGAEMKKIRCTKSFYDVKMKFYHDFFDYDAKKFMQYSILYWTIMYSENKRTKRHVIQRDLIPDLLKMIYF